MSCCVLLFVAELAITINKLFGGVCYASIDTDSDLKYPKGAAKVLFSNHQSYVNAITTRFVQLQHGDTAKRVRKHNILSFSTPINTMKILGASQKFCYI